MHLIKAVWCSLSFLLMSQVLAQSATTEGPAEEISEEIVVVGRMPGPPLWKISNGEHVMWIFPYIGVIPKDMEWESGRVEKLIAEAQEYLPKPDGGHGITVSLNPVNLVRLASLFNKNTHLPEGQTFADVLPAPLYKRFISLKARYFPKNDKIEKLVPHHAGDTIRDAIFDHEKLSSRFVITTEIDKFVKRNRTIRITRTSHMVTDTVKFKELKEIEEREEAAFSIELQVACMEKQIAYLENEVPLLKDRANAWAQGYTDDLLVSAQVRDDFDPCASAEFRDDKVEIETIRQKQWLAAAEAALTTNDRTFAVLGINDIVDQNGLVAQLQAKGYTVEISAK